jgi:DNA-binding NarL/FixJ family response regulator
MSGKLVPRIRVLVADDHPVVCTGLASIIRTEPDMEVVGQASNGEQAVRMFRQYKPDIALMDLRMPVMDGVEAIRAIRSENPAANVIVLTTYQGDEDIHRAVKAGARSYLLKGMSDVELLAAIRNVHAGHRYFPQSVRETLANRTPNSELSGRELQVLALIVRGLSNRQIGEALEIAEATVKWHMNIIFSRLHVSHRTHAAVIALSRGLVEM